jgi:hypothetical protein
MGGSPGQEIILNNLIFFISLQTLLRLSWPGSKDQLKNVNVNNYKKSHIDS